MQRILSKIATVPFRVLAKIGRLLFHRVGIMVVIILMQLVLYGAAMVALRASEFYSVFNLVMLVLSVVAVFWIVGDESNPGYKIGWHYCSGFRAVWRVGISAVGRKPFIPPQSAKASFYGAPCCAGTGRRV